MIPSDANKGGSCCAQPIRSLTRLSFPDGTHVQVNGLDEILAALYAEGRQVNANTAQEIVERLKQKNFIPTSAQPEYEVVLLKEYKKYVEERTCCGPMASPDQG